MVKFTRQPSATMTKQIKEYVEELNEIQNTSTHRWMSTLQKTRVNRILTKVAEDARESERERIAKEFVFALLKGHSVKQLAEKLNFSTRQND